MSKLSVKKPFTVVVCVIIILVLGYQSFASLSTDLLPSMNLPYAIVITTYPGANPETVEMVVTDPVESAMATISNIVNVSSTSSQSYSMVICEFNQNANMDSVTIDIRESLDMIAGYWPDEIGSPMIMKLNPDMLPVMMMAVDMDGADLEALSDFERDTLSSELKSIEGVASVTASGLLDSSIEIVVSEKKVKKLNKKLMGKLDDQFDDAREEIADGQSKLEDGKAALDEQSEEATRQMLDASSAITSGKITLSEKEKEVKDGIAQIEAGEKELDAKEAELEAAEKELEKNEKTLLKLEEQLKKLQDQLDKDKVKLEELKGQIAEMEADPEADQTQLELLKAEAAALETAIEVAETGIKALADQGIKVGGTDEAKKQIKAGKKVIEETRKQLETSKKQLEEALKQLEAAKTTINEQESQLNAAQAAATAKLTDARIQIVTGQQQLDSAKEQLDAAVDAAKDQADLNGILTPDLIGTILTAQNFSMPAGYVTEDGVEYLVRVGDELVDREELGNLILFDLSEFDMGVVRLSDVADVVTVDNSADTYAKINGNNGIILSLEKQNGYSTADVAASIREYMAKAEEKYEGLHLTALMDQGIYIDYVVNSVLQNLAIGAVLAIIVLLVFLKDLRPTFTVAISIPISVVFALVLMYFTGITMNIISLSGLALGVGMLVDNAIVTIENIYRLRSEGMDAENAAIEGARQIAGAIIASTLTTVCIWAPIVFAEGLTRQLFVDLVLTIAYSLMASLIVALTVVPMASATLLKNAKEPKDLFFDKIKDAYGWLLGLALKVKPLVLIGALALFLVSGGVLLGKGFEFMGETNSTQITITVQMPEDSEFEATAAMSDEIISRVTEIEEVDKVGAIMGAGLSLMGSYSGSSTETVSMYVILHEDHARTSQEVAALIEEKTADLDCEVSVSGSSMDISALGSSGISVRIYGSELDTLMAIANDFAEILEGVEGTTDVSNGIQDPTPELHIAVDKNKAMKNGLTVAQVFQELYGKTTSPASKTTLKEGNNSYPVTVKSLANESMTTDDIKDYVFTVTKQDGTEKKVKLSKIADITETQALSSISRSGQQRYLTVSAAIDEEHNVTLVAEEFMKQLDKYAMPEGYKYETSGEDETINDAMGQLLKLLGVGTLIMYLIMVAQFQSLLSPFIVLFTLPLAFTGGFLGLILTGNIISIISMVGFVMLCGIIVNNGIVFIDYVNQLRAGGMKKREALIETGRTRLRPILMTALTTILAMSTMALGMGEGTDMVQPMAIVTIGGLIYGTLMTLFVVPCIYDIFIREKKS